jgi:hypothetical protein
VTTQRTPLDLLDVLKVDVTLYANDLTRLRLNGSRPSDDVLADLTAGKPEILFRLLLRQWFAWTILEADGTPCLLGEKAGAVLAAEWRAAQALGLERAEAVRQDEYRLFFHKTNRCPTCGDRGPVPSDEVDHPHHQQRKRPEVVERPAVPAVPVAPAPRLRPRARRGKPPTNQGDQR